MMRLLAVVANDVVVADGDGAAGGAKTMTMTRMSTDDG